MWETWRAGRPPEAFSVSPPADTSDSWTPAIIGGLR
jgi:hypothetical protein